MSKTITKLKCTVLAAAAFSAFCASPALAQLNYRAAGATNIAPPTGSYVDLGTTGTAITTTSTDNADSAPQPIGFTFSYNGQPFTQFVLNTNGYIKLGATGSSAQTIFANLWGATDANLIAPLSGVDLQGAANQTTNPTEYRVVTTGTAPNRVTTIQWENVADKATLSGTTTIPSQFNTMQFQVKLYETSNNIEFVYGAWTANTNTATGQPFLVGLKGNAAGGEADRLFASKSSSASAWSTTIFDTKVVQGGISYLASHFVRNTFLPDAGRTYRFTPSVIPANDAAVQGVFVQGKVAQSSGAGSQIRAKVKNTGSAALTNKTFTLNISGANTFTSSVTLANLPVGKDSVITFGTWTPANIGNNLVEVLAPADGDLTNNGQDANVVVTSNVAGYATYSATTPNVPEFTTTSPAPFGSTVATNTGTYLAKFQATNRVHVTKVRVYVPGAGFNTALNNVGNVIFGSLFNNAGIEVARSANMTLTAADLDAFVEFTFTSPVVFQNETFYAGVGVPLNAAATKYTYPVTKNDIGVSRPGTYYATQNGSPTTPSTLIDINDKYDLAIEVEMNNITGMKEELNASAVSVYPNPSNGVFNIKAKDLKGNNLTLEVRDLTGKVVYSANASKTDASVDLSNVAAGVYILKASTDSEMAIKRLIVK